MSSVLHQMVSFWDALPQTTVHADTLAAGNVIYKGVLGFSVDGKAYSADSVLNSSNALYLTVAGADANGGVVLWSKQQNVRYLQYDTNGATRAQPLVSGIVYNTVLHTIDVFTQLETDSMGVIQSTAIQVVNSLLAHGEITKFLRFTATGTMTGLAGVTPGSPEDYVAVPQVFLLGVAQDTYDNSASMTDLVDEFRFNQGVCRVASLPSDPVTPAMKGGQVRVVDNVTVAGTPTSIDYTVKLIDVATSGAIFVDIQA